MAQAVVEGDFGGFQCPKAEGLSGGEFQFVVHPLNHAGRNLAPSVEPVEDQLSVMAQTTGHGLQGFEPRPHHLRAPLVEEAPGPMR